jgi:WD40 repeat protein
VLLPATVVQGRRPQQIEPILAHELVHVRRGDAAAAALQVLAQVIWWFHPLVWWANRRACRERERCCDEEVVAGFEYRPAEYARCLLDVLEAGAGRQPFFAAPGVRPIDVTSARLESIVKRASRLERRTPGWCWAVGLFVAALALPGGALAVGRSTPTVIGSQRSPVSAELRRPTRYLRSPNPDREEIFGYALAVVGNRVLVGAPSRPGAGSTPPATAYLFEGATGRVVRAFRTPGVDYSARVGLALAAAGGRVLVSAPGPEAPGYSRTERAVFLYDGASGELIHTFRNPQPAPDDRFGYAVAAVGGKVAISAHLDDTGARNAGVVHLFDATTGELARTVPNPTPDVDDGFGFSLAAIGGNLLAVASRDNAGAEDAGAVYLLDSSTGRLLQTYVNPTPAPHDGFGWSISAMDGNVLVGACFDNTGAEHAGAAYLFDGTTGKLLQTYRRKPPRAKEKLGWGLAVVGDNVLVSSHRCTRPGTACLFEAKSGELLRTFVNPDGGCFHRVVALSGDFLASGSGADGNRVVYLLNGRDESASRGGKTR